MAPNPYQVGSPTCGCIDCKEDFPPAQYGERPDRDGCLGRWRVRFRSADGRLRLKSLDTAADAHRFLATVQTKAVAHGA